MERISVSQVLRAKVIVNEGKSQGNYLCLGDNVGYLSSQISTSTLECSW